MKKLLSKIKNFVSKLFRIRVFSTIFRRYIFQYFNYNHPNGYDIIENITNIKVYRSFFKYQIEIFSYHPGILRTKYLLKKIFYSIKTLYYLSIGFFLVFFYLIINGNTYFIIPLLLIMILITINLFFILKKEFFSEIMKEM